MGMFDSYGAGIFSYHAGRRGPRILGLGDLDAEGGNIALHNRRQVENLSPAHAQCKGLNN